MANDNCIVVETFGFINSKFWLVKFSDRYVCQYLVTQDFSQFPIRKNKNVKFQFSWQFVKILSCENFQVHGSVHRWDIDTDCCCWDVLAMYLEVRMIRYQIFDCCVVVCCVVYCIFVTDQLLVHSNCFLLQPQESHEEVGQEQHC